MSNARRLVTRTALAFAVVWLTLGCHAEARSAPIVKGCTYDSTGKAVQNVTVTVQDSGGMPIGTGLSNANGAYTISFTGSPKADNQMILVFKPSGGTPFSIPTPLSWLSPVEILSTVVP
jgi:predicted secreted Zn-dependent protease